MSSAKPKPESIVTNIEKRNSFSSLITPTSLISPNITGSYTANTGLDLTDLKEKDADVKAWINKMLSSSTTTLPKPNDTIANPSPSDISPATLLTSPPSANTTTTTPLDQHQNIPQQASILLIKLENAGQQISKSIEKISSEVVKNIPRVMYDIENIRKDTRTMQDHINQVRMDYRKFNTDSSEVIQPMFLLDTIRLRMEETRKLLKEAENWSNLSSEMDDLFTNKEYERAALTLEDAQNSLALLKNSADYEEKHELLRKYLNRLEAELSPLLLQTIKAKDIQNLRKYQKIFKKIDREKEFYNCYFRNVKQEILEYWMGFDVKDSEQKEVEVPMTPMIQTSELTTGDTENTVTEETKNVLIINSTNPHNLNFAEWVASYFEELYSIIVKEFNWSANIFKQPGDIVCHLINESHKYLKPPFATRLESVQETSKDHFIVDLINIYKTVEQFAKTIEHHILFQRETNRFLKMSSFSPSPKSSLNRFTKTYHLGNWGETLFEPFLPYQQNFAHLEYSFLLDQLKGLFKPDVMAHKTPNELVDHLQLAVDKIFDQLTGTMKRCMEFTYGFACPATLKIMNDYLIAALEKYSDILRVIRSRTEIKLLSKIREEHKLGIHSPLSSTASLHSAAKSSQESVTVADTDEDLFQERNRQIWVNFQLGFKLLGVCCLFDKEVKQLDHQKLSQFFDLVFSQRTMVEGTQDLLGQLNTLLKMNHADSLNDLEVESPLMTKKVGRKKSKIFNRSGDNIDMDEEDEEDEDEVPPEAVAVPIGEGSTLVVHSPLLSSSSATATATPGEGAEVPRKTATLPTEEDPEVVKRRQSKSEKEAQLFQKLYPTSTVGSVLSREMIRLSSLNSYELRECCRIIAKQYYQPLLPDSTATATPTATADALSATATPVATTVTDLAALHPYPPTAIQSTMLNNVKSRLAKITNEVQRFIYDALFLTIDEQLSDLYRKDRWSHALAATKVSPFNFEIPQFSLSPSSYIVSVGEHLLSLPQHLELYLNDEALTYSVHTLPYCQPMELLTRSLLEDLGITPSASLSPPKSSVPEEDSEFEEPSGHMWIVSLCNGTMIKYVKNIMKLPELTVQESKQLGTDVSYLMNIFGALEIYVIPVLSTLQTFSQMTDSELTQRKGELEALLDQQLHLDTEPLTTTTTSEEGPSDRRDLEASMLLPSLTEHEKYELIKLFIKIRHLH